MASSQKLKKNFEEINKEKVVEGLNGIELVDNEQFIRLRLDSENNAGFMIGLFQLAQIISEEKAEEYMSGNSNNLFKSGSFEKEDGYFYLKLDVDDVDFERLKETVSLIYTSKADASDQPYAAPKATIFNQSRPEI